MKTKKPNDSGASVIGSLDETVTGTKSGSPPDGEAVSTCPFKRTCREARLPSGAVKWYSSRCV